MIEAPVYCGFIHQGTIYVPIYHGIIVLNNMVHVSLGYWLVGDRGRAGEGGGGGGGEGGGTWNSEIFWAGVCRWNFEYTPYSYNFQTDKKYLFISFACKRYPIDIHVIVNTS